jgi:hypothetical protein
MEHYPAIKRNEVPTTWMKLNLPQEMPRVVVYTCNPSYAGEGHKRMVVQGQPREKVRSYLNKQARHSVHSHNPSYKGDVGRRTVVPGWPWAGEPQDYLKKN